MLPDRSTDRPARISDLDCTKVRTRNIDRGFSISKKKSGRGACESISYTLLTSCRIGPSTSTRRPEGRSHFAEFVASLADAKDVKDAAVLTGALRALGNQLREPRSKALDSGLFELRGTRVRIYYGFLPGRRVVLVGGYVKKRTDTPTGVLRLMHARLKEAQDEHEESRARIAGRKSR
jgi:phage-related protein